MLSDQSIKQCLQQGDLVIYPFHHGNLNSCSYDVTLGKYLYRMQPTPKPKPGEGPAYLVHHPYSRRDTAIMWGTPAIAAKAKDIPRQLGLLSRYDDLQAEDLIILVKPGETILTHTFEFAGTQSPHYACSLQPRASFASNFIHIQPVPGQAGFIGRWTLLITNTHKTHHIPLVVGRRIAQLRFHALSTAATLYKGKYHMGYDLKTVHDSWVPACMLSKLNKDSECDLNHPSVHMNERRKSETVQSAAPIQSAAVPQAAPAPFRPTSISKPAPPSLPPPQKTSKGGPRPPTPPELKAQKTRAAHDMHAGPPREYDPYVVV